MSTLKQSMMNGKAISFIFIQMSEFTIIYQCVMLIMMGIMVFIKLHHLKTKNKTPTHQNLHPPMMPVPSSLNTTTPYTGLG